MPPRFPEALEQKTRVRNIPDGGYAAHVLVMKTMHEAVVVTDRKRVIDVACCGKRLMNAEAVAELPEQQDQARAIARDSRRLMQHDVDAIGTPGKQQLVHQSIAARRIEVATDRAVEDAYRALGVGEQLVKRRIVCRNSRKLLLAWHAIGRDD